MTSVVEATAGFRLSYMPDAVGPPRMSIVYNYAQAVKPTENVRVNVPHYGA